MKRSWRLLIALLAVFALVAAACGDDDDEGGSGDGPCGGGGVETAQSEVAGSSSGDGSGLTVGLVHNGRGDGSFNDSAVVGYDAAIADFGISDNEVVVNLTGGETGATEVETLAASGPDLSILIGFLLTDAAAAGSTAFPDEQFALLDSGVDAGNVKALVFAEEEGSFLVGAIAALCSASGNVGFIGGVETDLIKKFEAGFAAGARAVNSDIEVQVNYISQPPDFSGFGDPVKGKEIALAQLEAGADVIYSAAGGSGNGMFEAVTEAVEGGDYAWSIGVDSDQGAASNVGVPDAVKGEILTSMLKRVDVAVYSTIDDLVNGNYEGGGAQVFNLSVDGVGYSTTGGHLSQDQVDQIEDFKQQIIAGDIEVPSAP